jgi:hypothetical protein
MKAKKASGAAATNSPMDGQEGATKHPAPAAEQPEANRPLPVYPAAGSLLFQPLVRVLVAYSVLLAGGLYAWGAIVEASELHEADQALSSTLPLVPLQTFLVRGINEALGIGLVALVAMSFAAAVGDWEFAKQDPAGHDAAGISWLSRPIRGGKWLFWPILGFVLGSLIFLPIPFGFLFAGSYLLSVLHQMGRLKLETYLPLVLCGSPLRPLGVG